MIRFYQRFVSPYKGFGCAYRAHSGCAGCSALGYRAIRRHGLVDGIAVLRKRLYRCGVAYRRFAVAAPLRSRQAGFCDWLDLGASACYCGPDLACVACDLFGKDESKKAAEDEQQVHLPNHLPQTPVPVVDEFHPPEGGWKA